MLIDSMGELEFGAGKPEGKGWFPTAEEFLPEWKSKDREFVLVIEKRGSMVFLKMGRPMKQKRSNMMTILFFSTGGPKK